MIDIFTEFNNQPSINFDRSITVNDTLPYNSSNYLIQPNELSYYKTLNKKLSYLYDNFMYIYSRCFIANFVIPTSFTGFIGVTGSNFGLYKNTSISNKFLSSGYYDLDFVQNFTILNRNDKNYLFLNSLSSINIIEHDLINNNISYKSKITFIDPVSGEISFKKINNLTLGDEFLYVSEGIFNIVYKYDLKMYFSNENIYKNKLFFKKSVGGEGGRYDPIKFNNPKNISYNDGVLMVEDFGNKVLKFFGKELEFLSYNTLINLYDNLSAFSSIKFQDGENIIATVKNGILKFKLENNRIKSNIFYSLSSFLEEDEKIIDINFSNYEKDIIYILTNKNLYKKWHTDVLKTIGKKNVLDFGIGSEFKSFSTIKKNLSSDLIYIYTYNGGASANQILIYEDNLDLISTLNDQKFLIYSKDEILIKKQEYNQSWVYSKNIRKLAKNYDTLKNNVAYKFVTEYDSKGLLKYVGKIYNTDVLNYPQIDYDEFYCIGVNENFQASVINREFDKIYDLSKSLLYNVLSEFNTTLNLNPSSFI